MQRPRLVAALDWVAAATILAGLAVASTGGFVETIAGIRLSVRSESRLFALAALVAALRLALDRRRAPFGVTVAAWRRWRAVEWAQQDAYAASRPAHRRRAALLAALGICAFGAVLLHGQLRHPFSVPDYGDPLFSIWRLGWVPHQLRTDPRHLFDANIFHPDRLTLTYSDAIPLPALMAAALEAVGVHPVVAYNILVLSGFFLSAWTMYLLVARLTICPHAAFVSALIFGFYPYRFEQYNHLELQMTWWMPLALLFVQRGLAAGRTRDAVAAGLCLVAQLYSSMYYFAFFGVYLAAVLLVLLPTARVRVRRLMPAAVFAAALVGLLAVPLEVPYAQGQPLRGDRSLATVAEFSARATDYLGAHERSALYGSRLGPGREGERALFPGVLPIALSAAALVPPVGLTSVAYATALTVAFEASRGTNGVLYGLLYRWLPPFRSMRVAARFGMLVGLSLAVLSGFAVRRLIARFSSRLTRRAVLAAIVIALAIDFWPTLDLYPVWRDPPAIYEQIRNDASVVLAEFPLSSKPEDISFSTIFMYFSRWHWSQTVNGYSGNYTQRYIALVHDLQGFPTPTGVATLRAVGVTHVSVICALLSGECPALLDRIDANPVFQPVASTMWDGHPARLYRLNRDAPVK